MRGKLVVAASGPGKRSSFRPRNCFPVKRLWIDRGKECSSTGMDTANTKKGSVSGGLWICDFFRGLIWPEIPGLRDTNYSISVSSNGIEKGSRYIVLRDISLNYKKKRKIYHERNIHDTSRIYRNFRARDQNRFAIRVPYSLAVSHKPGQPALRHDNDNDRCLNLLDNGSEKARVPFFLLFFFSRYDSAICKSLNNLEFHRFLVHRLQLERLCRVHVIVSETLNFRIWTNIGNTCVFRFLS